MNKKIKELAEQQGLTGSNYFISSQELEKFAESIIQESVDFLTQTACDYEAEMLRSYWDES
jgi:hypothetical protein